MKPVPLYTVIPLKTAFLHKARQQGWDDQHQAVERLIASGGEPCRDVLRPALAGEVLILASYCPFEIAGPYREFGPVFILQDGSPTDDSPSTLASLIERNYLDQQFVLRAYCAQERIIDARLSSPTQYAADLGIFFANPQVQFVLVRYAGYGCYACRVERPENPA